MINGMLPPHVEEQLRAILFRQDTENIDGMCWGPTSTGSVSVRSTYTLTEKKKSESVPPKSSNFLMVGSPWQNNDEP